MSNSTQTFDDALSAFNNRDLKRAEKLFREVIKSDGSHIAALNLLVVVLMSMERFAEAEPFIARATSLNQQSDVSFYNYGLISKHLNKHQQALENFSKAIDLNPNIPETWNNRGTVFNDLKKYDLAIADFEKAIALNSRYGEAYANMGKSLMLLRHLEEASAAYDKALSIRPDLVEAWLGRGNVLCDLKRHEAAFAAYDKALSIKSDLAEAWLGRGNLFYDLKRYDEALAAYDKALSLTPDLAEAWLGRGNVFNQLKQYDQAIVQYSKALKLRGDVEFAKGMLLYQKMLICDWNNFDVAITELANDIFQNRKSAFPFGWQAVATSEESLQRCAQIWNESRYPPRASRHVSKRKTAERDKIRIGYVSGEFRDQATSHLVVGLLESHDKSKFEVFGFDNGWSDNSLIRQRIERALDQLIPIRALNDVAVVDKICELQVDILVNLNGYFGDERTSIFVYRGAPIQVNYLGFPGTLGADYIDYIVADACVIPPENRQFYNEKVVWLPGAYQPNDRSKVIGQCPSRAECGLPPQSFVFCCFNNNYKITPSTFDSWMRVLNRVDNSVLWLIDDNPDAKSNLRKEARSRGIDDRRLVFAQRVPLSEHLARHRLADLFLDTLPCNAHTTASDALWAGLPVLTLTGSTFTGRVAASLLKAIDLPELITHMPEDYEARAIELALNREKLKAIAEKLARNRLTTPLFDPPLYAKHLEAAYAAMYRRYGAGLAPDHIEIENATRDEPSSH